MINKLTLSLMLSTLLLISNVVKVNAEEIKDNEVTISFVGDCTIGEYKGQGTGNQFKDYFNANGGNYFFNNVKSIFESDDITFINLEGPLTDKPQIAVKQFPIRCESEHINVLNNSSIEVVNLSNNHIYDCGQDGFNDTKAILTANNIGYCGEDNEYIINKNNIQISFLGYQGWSNTKELKDKISSDIDNAHKNGSQIICVMFHWGEERKYYSNSIQEDLAHYTIDSGADIVVGSHPHVIQGIENYNGKTIVYSLGNFTFGANKNPKDKDTFIYQQTFKVTPNGVEYKNYNIIPCSISSEANKNNYQPTILDTDNKERVLNRLKEYSSKYKESIFNFR